MRTAYGDARILARTEGMSQDMWLSMRKLGIGASEVPAVLGIDRYAGAWTVAARKLNIVSESSDTTATRWGKQLEPLVLAETATELGVAVEAVPCTLGPRDVSSPLRVSLDGWCAAQEAPVEVKAPFRLADHYAWRALRETGDATEGSSVEGYWWQVQAQMLATGSQQAYLSGLFDGSLYVCRIVANAEAQRVIAEHVTRVWDVVERVRSDRGLHEQFVNGALIVPTPVDRGEWQRTVTVGEEVQELTDASIEAKIEQMRMLEQQTVLVEARLEQIKTELLAFLTSRGLERGYTPNYELIVRSTKRSSNEYQGAPASLLADLRAFEVEAKAAKERLKKYAVINQSLRVEAKLRGVK